MRTTILVALLPLYACRCDDDLGALPGALRGTVCHPDTGAPLAGAALHVEASAGAPQDAVADADGAFAIDGLAAGDVTLTATAGDVVRTFPARIDSAETAVLVDPACRPLPGPGDTGAVAGAICNRHTGAFVTQADVYVLTTDGAVVTTTDDDGAFVLPGVPVGEQVLTVAGAGFSRSFLVVVRAGETTHLDLADDCRAGSAADGSVEGRLCDVTTGDPLVGASVSLIGDVDRGEDVTDVDGAFFYAPLLPATYRVEVTRAPDVGFTLDDVVVAAGAATIVAGPHACGFVPPTPVDPAEETGVVEGDLCAPDGVTNLVGATVYIVRDDGSRASTTTDDQGHFTLTGAPAGSQVLHVEKGSFHTTIDVVVPVNGTLTIPAEECEVPLDGAAIAVVTGEWDDVGTVLLDVGVDPTSITTYPGTSDWEVDLLEDWPTLAGYDLVFVNCGADLYGFLSSPVAIANLQQFVAEGGGLYVSDLAYDLVEVAFPDSIEFYGNDAQRGAANEGEIVDALPGTVTDAALSAALGTTSVELHYPYGFAVMQSVATTVKVYIRGDAPLWSGGEIADAPHIVGFPSGEGRVIYTSFHQEPGIHPQMEQVLHLLMFEL